MVKIGSDEAEGAQSHECISSIRSVAVFSPTSILLSFSLFGASCFYNLHYIFITSVPLHMVVFSEFK